MHFAALFALVLLGTGSGTGSGTPKPHVSSPRNDRGVLFVDDSAPTGGNGLSWNTAFRYLSDALVLASSPNSGVNEIRVGQGLYRPDRNALHPGGSGLRTATFQLTGGIFLLGGYAGFGSADPDANDPQQFESVLSGDLAGNDLPDFGNTTDNSYHVVTVAPSSLFSRLDGFTVRDGNADLAQNSPGAGLVMNTANLEMSRCFVTDNFAIGFGGGMCTSNGQFYIHDCTFEANHTLAGAGGLDAETDDEQIVNCVFFNNKAIGGEPSRGGGLRCSGFDMLVSNVELIKNEAGEGGGMIVYGSATIEHCTFLGNTSTYTLYGGSGLRYTPYAIPSRIISCGFYGNNAGGIHGGALSVLVFDHLLEVTNCIFSGNMGKAIFAESNNPSSLPRMPIKNCTFVHNTGVPSVARFDNYSGAFTNCILWDNAAPVFQVNTGLPILITYSVTTLAGAGNSSANPLLIDSNGADNIYGTADDDVHLSPGSPAVDAGSNSAVPAYIMTDFDGAPRFVDDPTTPDTGLGTPPIVDKGALEFQLPVCGDLNGDGQVDLVDFDIFMLAFGTSLGQPGFNPAADFNDDGVVGLADYGIWYQCYVNFN